MIFYVIKKSCDKIAGNNKKYIEFPKLNEIVH